MNEIDADDVRDHGRKESKHQRINEWTLHIGRINLIDRIDLL
jgi:hypothetical protein